MPDVIDFLVLRQNYDEALRTNWKPSECLLNLPSGGGEETLDACI